MNILLFFLPLLLSWFFSSLFPMDKVWTNSLQQSPYTPPDYVFPIAWTFLYLTIGYGLMQPNSDWLVLNLVLNFTWLLVFNQLKSLRGGFWILMAMCLSLIMYLDRTKNYVLVPYLVWLLFALYLNCYLMVNNPEKDHQRLIEKFFQN